MVANRTNERSIEGIAARLVATRKAFAMPQIEFAEKAGIPGNTYNQYEKAKSRPNLDFAVRLCDTYGLTLDWIYFGDPRGLSYDTAQRIIQLLPDQSGLVSLGRQALPAPSAAK